MDGMFKSYVWNHSYYLLGASLGSPHTWLFEMPSAERLDAIRQEVELAATLSQCLRSEIPNYYLWCILLVTASHKDDPYSTGGKNAVQNVYTIDRMCYWTNSSGTNLQTPKQICHLYFACFDYVEIWNIFAYCH